MLTEPLHVDLAHLSEDLIVGLFGCLRILARKEIFFVGLEKRIFALVSLYLVQVLRLNSVLR